MADSSPLKQKNLVLLAAYLALHGGFIAWIFLGQPTALEALSSLSKLDCTKALGAFGLALAAIFLNGLPNRDFKASLVYWSGRNALPSTRWVKLAETDRRFHISQLQERLGGNLPTTAAEQSYLWNKIYRQHEADPAVRVGHQEFLLMRDLTWLTTLLAVVGGLGIYLGTHGIRPTLTYLWLSAVCYLALSMSARNSGKYFVLTVLACEAAKADKTPRIITDSAC